MRTREGMAIARARGRLKGRKPKLTARQQAELTRMHVTGEYTIADLMEVFSVGRATVYRVLNRAATSTPGPDAVPGPSPDTPACQAARAQKAPAAVQPATDTGRFRQAGYDGSWPGAGAHSEGQPGG
jgi:hypothetical protein